MKTSRLEHRVKLLDRSQDSSYPANKLLGLLGRVKSSAQSLASCSPQRFSYSLNVWMAKLIGQRAKVLSRTKLYSFCNHLNLKESKSTCISIIQGSRQTNLYSSNIILKERNEPIHLLAKASSTLGEQHHGRTISR